MFLIKSDTWEVKKTKNKGLGIFTKKKIKAGTVIGDYIGKVIKIEEYNLDEDKKGLYLMYYNDKAAIYPDLKNPGIHLLNHSCSPNCWIYIYKNHTLFFALRDINPEEELTISYLLSPKTKNCDPCSHICRCDSTSCTGTMHLSEKKYAAWQKFQETQKRSNVKEKLIFNKQLPRLSTYPRIVSNYLDYAEIANQ